MGAMRRVSVQTLGRYSLGPLALMVMLWGISYAAPDGADFTDAGTSRGAGEATSFAVTGGRFAVGSLRGDPDALRTPLWPDLPRSATPTDKPQPWNWLGFGARAVTRSGPAGAAASGWAVSIPCWFPLVLVGVLPALWFRAERRQRLRASRRGGGRCPNCAYDLIGSASQCPECGWRFIRMR